MNAEYFSTGYVDEAPDVEPELPEDERDYSLADAALVEDENEQARRRAGRLKEKVA